MTAVPLASTPPIRRITARPDIRASLGQWPANIPAVAGLLSDGLDLGLATVLVGDNGSGKSTIVEAIASLLGVPPGGGSNQAMFQVRPSESPLPSMLQLQRTAGASRWAYFLRAETMHGLYTYLEQLPQATDTDLHERSHGEGFLAIVERKFGSSGVYLLDEPESALSFTGCLALLGHLHAIVARGAQVIVATHSPVVAALPGARILELGDWGIRESTWADTDLVTHHRGFLRAPESYLRHVIDEWPPASPARLAESERTAFDACGSGAEMAVLVGWTLSAVASTTVALARIVGPSMRVGPLPKDVTGAGGRQHGGRGGVAGGGRPHQ